MRKAILLIRLSIVVAVVGILISSIPNGEAQTSKEIVLRAVTFVPYTDDSLFGYWHFEKLVNDRGKGKIRIEFVGGPEAIAPMDQGKAVASGVVDMACVPPAFYKPLVPIGEAQGYLEIDPKTQRERGAYDLILESHLKANLYYLCYMDYGNQAYLYLNKKVSRPQELRGLRFRAGPPYQAFLDALGLATHPIPIGDVYTAMERGLIVGYPWPRTGIVKMGLGEVTKYRIDHGFWMSCLGVVINADKWRSLSKDAQDLVINCAREHERWVPEAYGKHLLVQDKEQQKAGIEFIRFSAEDAQWFTNLFRESSWAAFSKVDPELAAKAKKLFTVKLGILPAVSAGLEAASELTVPPED